MLPEFSDPKFHLPFDYPIRPDLGGTAYDFVKEFSRDKTTFFVKNGDCLVKITAPDHQPLKITVEGPQGLPFFETYYDFMGELISASIWFRRCLDVPWQDFDMDDATIETYCQLADTESDFMLEADLRAGVLHCYHCNQESSDPDSMKVFSFADSPLARSIPILLKFTPPSDGEINPVNLYAKIEDNVLSFGFCINGMSCLGRSASLDVNFGRLGQNVTPGEVRRIIKNAFVLI